MALPETAPLPKCKIVVVLDGSDSLEQPIFDVATWLAWQQDSEVLLAGPVMPQAGHKSGTRSVQVHAFTNVETRAMLLVRRFARAGVRAVATVRYGPPDEALCEVIALHHANLLVVGESAVRDNPELLQNGVSALIVPADFELERRGGDRGSLVVAGDPTVPTDVMALASAVAATLDVEARLANFTDQSTGENPSAPLLLIPVISTGPPRSLSAAARCHNCGRPVTTRKADPQAICSGCGFPIHACANCDIFDGVLCKRGLPMTADTAAKNRCREFKLRLVTHRNEQNSTRGEHANGPSRSESNRSQ